MKITSDNEIIDSVGIEVEFSCFDRQNDDVLRKKVEFVKTFVYNYNKEINEEFWEEIIK